MGTYSAEWAQYTSLITGKIEAGVLAVVNLELWSSMYILKDANVYKNFAFGASQVYRLGISRSVIPRLSSKCSPERNSWQVRQFNHRAWMSPDTTVIGNILAHRCPCYRVFSLCFEMVRSRKCHIRYVCDDPAGLRSFGWCWTLKVQDEMTKAKTCSRNVERPYENGSFSALDPSKPRYFVHFGARHCWWDNQPASTILAIFLQLLKFHASIVRN